MAAMVMPANKPAESVKTTERVDYAIKAQDHYVTGDESDCHPDIAEAARFDKRSDAYRCIERIERATDCPYEPGELRVVRIRTKRTARLATLKAAARAYAKANAAYHSAWVAFRDAHPAESGKSTRELKEMFGEEWAVVDRAIDANNAALTAMQDAAKAYGEKGGRP